MTRFHRILAAIGLSAFGLALATSATAGATDAHELATIDREAYSVEVSDVSAAAGADATVEVTVKAKAGHKVNEQYPHKLKVEDVPDGLVVPNTLLKKADGKLVDKTTFVFTLPVKATRAGTFVLAAKLKTSVCNDQQCLIKKESITATITAK